MKQIAQAFSGFQTRSAGCGRRGMGDAGTAKISRILVGAGQVLIWQVWGRSGQKFQPAQNSATVRTHPIATHRNTSSAGSVRIDIKMYRKKINLL